MPRGTQENTGSLASFAYGAVTLYDGPSQGPSARNKIGNFHGSGEAILDIPYNPTMT